VANGHRLADIWGYSIRAIQVYVDLIHARNQRSLHDLILAELRNLAGGVKGLLGPLGGTAKEAADAVDKITGSSDKATKGIKKLGEGEADAKKLGRGLKDAEKNAADLNNSIEKVMRAVKFMAGGFLALEGVRWVKDLADTAARNEVLATVLHVVGKNAGYSREELDKADRSIQKLGITAQASRQSMTQFLQGGFKLDKLEALAKAAQDTAVVLGTDSSEAFQRMITAVQTMNTLSLRTMGIIVTNEQAQERYAAKIGKTANQLTLMQQQEALLQATLDKSKKLQGASKSSSPLRWARRSSQPMGRWSMSSRSS